MRGITSVSLLAAVTLSADGQGAAVDIAAFHGWGLLVLNSSATAAADNTADVKLQHSDDGATGWTDVPDGAFVQVTNAAASHQVKGLNLSELKRYVRLDYDLGGTSPEVTISAEIVGKPQYS